MFDLLVAETLDFKSRQYLNLEITLTLTLQPSLNEFYWRSSSAAEVLARGGCQPIFRCFLVCPKSPTLIPSQEVWQFEQMHFDIQASTD